MCASVCVCHFNMLCICSSICPSIYGIYNVSIYLSSGHKRACFRINFQAACQFGSCCSCCCCCICCCSGLLNCPQHCQTPSLSLPLSIYLSLHLTRPLFRRFVWKVVVQLPFTFAASIFGFKSSLESFCDCYCTPFHFTLPYPLQRLWSMHQLNWQMANYLILFEFNLAWQKLMQLGLSKATICVCSGVPQNTLYSVEPIFNVIPHYLHI